MTTSGPTRPGWHVITPLRHISLARNSRSPAVRCRARWLMNQWAARAADLRARLAKRTRPDGRPYTQSTMQTYRTQLKTLERPQRDASAQLDRFETEEEEPA